MRALKKILLSSKFWGWFYSVQALVWLITFPPAVLFWSESVMYLIIISQMTALTGALGGLATVLAERKADPLMAEVDPEDEE